MRSQWMSLGTICVLAVCLFGPPLMAGAQAQGPDTAQKQDVSKTVEVESLDEEVRKKVEKETPALEVALDKIRGLDLIVPGEDVHAFGYDFFKSLTAEGVTENRPISPNYLLGPGDEIIVDIWGHLSLNCNLTVNKQGYIRIPDLGRVYLNGVTFGRLKDKILRELSKVYASSLSADNLGKGLVSIEVTLGKIRGVHILVSGRVEKPGSYAFPASAASIFNVLTRAGGITHQGSLRQIKIAKSTGRSYLFDFYDLLLTGKIETEKTQLQEGDIVFVPLKSREVTITGEVKCPAIYELKRGEELVELLDIAGGFAPRAYLGRVQIIRYVLGEGRRILDIDFKEIKDKKRNFKLVDGDRIHIFSTSISRRENIVEIVGEGIRRPGMYQLKKGMTVKELVREAGGLYPDALLEKADLLRTLPDLTKEFRTFNIGDALKEDGKANFLLEPLAKITVYSKYQIKGGEKTVTIKGHVKHPGSYSLADNRTLYDLIFSAGGFQDPDFKKATYLERADLIKTEMETLNKTIIPFNLGRLLDGDEGERSYLEDKDILYLRSGDEIVIYAFSDFEDKEYVTIKGEVRKPGRYELREDMTVSDLITQAKGLKETAFISKAEVCRVVLDRISGERKIETLSVRLEAEDAKQFILRNHDMVFVRPVWESPRFVTITGEVKFPGEYVITHNDERLSSLIGRAGGLLNTAFGEAASFVRAKNDKGRVSIDLVKALKDEDGPYDVILVDGDQIDIPEKDLTVKVTGEVIVPSTVQYKRGANVGYYIDLVGGFKPSADKHKIRMIYPNGYVRKATRRFWFYPAVPAGSRVVVPEREAKGGMSWRGVIKNNLLILVGAAITAGIYSLSD